MTPLAALLRRAAPDPRPDGALLAAFRRDRDEPAFAELVRRHGPLVWGACRRALPDATDAEDAFQATFLVLVRRAGRLTAAATVGPWLLKVAALTARNARRKNARRLAHSAQLVDVADPRPAPDPAFDLDAALLALSERCRAALLLCYLEGLTHREAAARLGCTEGTVSSLVSRGLAKLRARLGREPVALLTAGAVPAAVEAAARRSAAAARLASVSASTLAQEVFRMFWVRRASAAGLATVALLVVGFAAGVSVRQAPDAAAQDKEKAAVTQPDPPAAPYIVFYVRGLDARPRGGLPEPYVITEYDATGKSRWTTIPAREAIERWATTPKLVELDQDAIIGGARDYLTRVKKDATAPHDLRVVFERDMQPGGFAVEALRACRDAGFDTIRFTGYLPIGGDFIPQLLPGPDGNAPGYRRYTGGPIETKRLIADYDQALRTW